jgi:predicted transposase YdaD
LPVESIVFLLRPEAQGTGFTGALQYQTPGGKGVDFSYHLIRVWELPVERLLAGPLATLPLAPISQVEAAALPGVIVRMQSRIIAETPVSEHEEWWGSVALLMGLRHKMVAIRELLKGVGGLEESTFYQEAFGNGIAIGEVKGRSGEARTLLLRIGSKRFGPATEAVEAAIQAIETIETLESLADRLLEVETWEELLRGQLAE